MPKGIDIFSTLERHTGDGRTHLYGARDAGTMRLQKKIISWLSDHRIGAPVISTVIIAVLIIATLREGHVDWSILDPITGEFRWTGVFSAVVFAFAALIFDLIGHECHRRVLDHLENLELGESVKLENQHLSLAVGLAIKAILADAVDGQHQIGLREDTRQWIHSKVQDHDANWQKLTSYLDPKHLRLKEHNLWRFIQKPDAPNLTSEDWYKGISSLGSPAFTATDPDGQALIKRLKERFGKALWEVIKRDYVLGGEQAEAMHLTIYAQLLSNTDQLLRNDKRSEAMLDQMKRQFVLGVAEIEIELRVSDRPQDAAALACVSKIHKEILRQRTHLSALQTQLSDHEFESQKRTQLILEKLPNLKWWSFVQATAILVVIFAALHTQYLPERHVYDRALKEADREAEILKASHKDA